MGDRLIVSYIAAGNLAIRIEPSCNRDSMPPLLS